MRKELDKKYDPGQVEDRIYDFWLSGGYFHAEPDPDKKPYTIVIPPPNITGQLHMGHALDAVSYTHLDVYKRQPVDQVVLVEKIAVKCLPGDAAGLGDLRDGDAVDRGVFHAGFDRLGEAVLGRLLPAGRSLHQGDPSPQLSFLYCTKAAAGFQTPLKRGGRCAREGKMGQTRRRGAAL